MYAQHIIVIHHILHNIYIYHFNVDETNVRSRAMLTVYYFFQKTHYNRS